MKRYLLILGLAFVPVICLMLLAFGVVHNPVVAFAAGFFGGWSIACVFWSPEFQGQRYKDIWDKHKTTNL